MLLADIPLLINWFDRTARLNCFTFTVFRVLLDMTTLQSSGIL